MSDVFEIVGQFVVGLLLLGVTIIAMEIVGNIYGGIKGAYRIRAIRKRAGGAIFPHLATVRLGLKAWSGRRYDGRSGYYWRAGSMEVPVDGRDPIRHKYYG